MFKTLQILGSAKDMLLLALFNKQAAPQELSPIEKEIAEQVAPLKALTKIQSADGRNVAFNSAPLSPEDFNEVRAHSFHLINKYEREPTAWKAVLDAQHNVFHRSAEQGYELAAMIYYNIRMSEGVVDQREIEMINEIAWMANNSKIAGTETQLKAHHLVALIKYTNPDLQNSLRSLVSPLPYASAMAPSAT